MTLSIASSNNLPMCPVVAITSDVKGIGKSPEHSVKEKYIEAVAGGCAAFPMLLPALEEGGEMRSLFDRFDCDLALSEVDGIFLTGNSSNIEPIHYGGLSSTSDTNFDRQRDNSNIKLIRWALSKRIPIFGLCRGLQEVNVALGGTLISELNKDDRYLNHLAPPDLPRSEQYAPAHALNLTEGGRFQEWLGTKSIQVNSLHEQGLGEISKDLFVEAVTHRDPDQWLIAVQWHPEWQYWRDPVSKQLLQCFGSAVRQRFITRRNTQLESA